MAFEKLWFLQKAHAQRFASAGDGDENHQFNDMVSRVRRAVEECYPADELYIPSSRNSIIKANKLEPQSSHPDH